MPPSQAVQRVSIRWLPDPAYEDTETIALNVGGYFIDLRVTKDTGSIQWSRAGERILLKETPLTFCWTHIIDSLDLTVPDEAYFKKLPNGDDLEIGTTPCPFKGGALTDYEEVWRDITTQMNPKESSWIFQSTDGGTFVGRVGTVYLVIRKSSTGEFTARREDLRASGANWETTFESDGAQTLPRASKVLNDIQLSIKGEGEIVQIDGDKFVMRAFSEE